VVQQQLTDLESRESDLLKNNSKLQDELLSLQQQQKELAVRQGIYNQQQLEFISRKNALAAQQFDFAEKLNTYHAQVKLFNENLEKLENERVALQKDKAVYEEQLREFERKKAEFENEKERLENAKDELLREQMEAQKRAHDDASGLHVRMKQLQEWENALQQRETNLNDRLRDAQNAQNAQAYAYGTYSQQQPSPAYPAFGLPNPQNQLLERAQKDGIRLNAVGTLRGAQNNNAPVVTAKQEPASAPAVTATPMKRGYFNMGKALFNSAFIMLCIVAFESLVVYFAKGYLNISVIYPAIGFTAGFIPFIVCAILYASGYKANAKIKKRASYILSASIIFVISVILVTMVAVYMKAQLSLLPQLLTYIVIPVAYLMNILFFVAFFYAFSMKASRK
ncbi:MAG: hypothetical protein IIY09_03695, partial [Clostridia bacterium]|nr:hypothetical protein [Clostridia bacterium]